MATAESTVQVKTRPIIFGADSVRAILNGSKSQTRRVVKWVPREEGLNLSASSLSVGFYCTGVPSSGYVLCSRDGRGVWNDRTFPLHCPYGKRGDRLWLKEAWHAAPLGRLYKDRHSVCYAADEEGCNVSQGWSNPMFMPRWASRITLEVTAVRVERLQEITREDALAEGVREIFKGRNFELRERRMCLEQHAYAEAWDELNAKRGYPWASNPFVWVLSFRRASDAS